MRDLLEKWTRLEPDRCYEVEYGDGTATAVTVAGETLYVDSPGRVKADQGVSRAFILAAATEAIEARGWEWSLWSDGALADASVTIPGEERRKFEKSGGGEPAVGLLMAYLEALQAEGES